MEALTLLPFLWPSGARPSSTSTTPLPEKRKLRLGTRIIIVVTVIRHPISPPPRFAFTLRFDIDRRFQPLQRNSCRPTTPRRDTSTKKRLAKGKTPPPRGSVPANPRLVCLPLHSVSAAGQVFVALDKRSNMKVAIKKMKLDDESAKLLASEIHMMKSSNHPNIVSYIDSYIVGGELWVRHSPTSPPPPPIPPKACFGVD